jgi:hypothetical protein
VRARGAAGDARGARGARRHRENLRRTTAELEAKQARAGALPQRVAAER